MNAGDYINWEYYQDPDYNQPYTVGTGKIDITDNTVPNGNKFDLDQIVRDMKMGTFSTIETQEVEQTLYGIKFSKWKELLDELKEYLPDLDLTKDDPKEIIERLIAKYGGEESDIRGAL